MWLANFENGNTVSSKNTFWTQLKERANGVRMTGLQLSSPLYPELSLCLSGLDRYYFCNEAVSIFGGPVSPEGVVWDKSKNAISSSVVAEIIGGHNLDLGIGVEIRLEYTGSVRTRVYAVEKYKYSKDILVDGSKDR